MKRNFVKKLLLSSLLFYSCFSFSQEFRTFGIRYQDNIKGDLTFIANNILNRNEGGSNGPNTPYNTTGSSSQFNDNFNMQYIDIDGDPTTFSSSSANFTFPNADCNLIRYAGLYWSATYPSEQAGQAVGTGRQNDFNQVRFRVPGGSYVNVTADEVLYDGFTSAEAAMRQNSPYACYADVTSLITALPNPTGEYTIANVRSVVGSLSPGGGASAGWTLVIVYENPTLSGKLITTFDGFARVRAANPTVDINYSGFNTIPAGPVRARIGVAALEGDNRIQNVTARIRAQSNAGFTTLSNAINPANNFFNSTISLDGVLSTNRTPNSANTLGYDTDIFLLNNPANSVIPNNETAATFRFTSNQDQYYPFFNSFNIEIIEPNIVVEKKVEDIAGNDITGAGVNLGQQLDYVLSFQNTGNDNAVNYTIRDVLPINVTFIPSNLVLPPGVTYVFDAPSNTITFTIPNNLVEVGDPISRIRMRVRVAENCFDFVNACTDLIQNLAFSTYRGQINDNQITDDPSVSDFDNCGFVTPGATNFLLDDLSDCDFSRTVQLCGANVLLDAGDNFDDYIWYRDVNENSVIDAGDLVLNDGNPDNDLSTLLVTQPGIYIVDKIVADPCKGFQEIITVIPFGATQINPIIDLINDPTNTVEGEVVSCSVDGDLLPKIFLCGLNDTELIQINIPDATSIIWQRLDETSCASSGDDCANKNGTCVWNQVSTGNSFLASDAGQYRLIINYQNGCFTRFYFNVFKNPLNPEFNKTDIICATPGNITVTNMPATYEFQLLNAVNGNILVPYSANNGPSFSIANNGAYTVEMRQQGVVGGCIFRLEDIGVLRRDLQVEITTRNTDCNGLGAISISTLNVEPQYYYEISQGGISVDTHGPSLDNNYTFENLNPGVYDVLATTDDGCSFTQQVTINDVNDLAATAITTKPIDCADGTIRVTGSGGVPNPDYLYAIWSYNGVDLYPNISAVPADQYQVESDFFFTPAQAGDYVFVVVDSNNCFAFTNTTNISLAPNAEYSPIITPEQCFGAADGSFAINVTNSNGYSLSYTLTYPDSSTATNLSGSFTNLAQGNYIVTITQTSGGVSCELVENFTITGPTTGLSATAVETQPYTCTQNGSIQAQSVNGGTAPYEYSIDGINFQAGVGAETFSNLTTGNFSITVRDAAGCIFVTNSIAFVPLNPPTDFTFTATAPNCPTQTSNVTVSVVNGNTPFIFSIVAPTVIAATSTTGNTATFNGLAPNTYTFRVLDDKGCSYDETYTIAPVSPIDVVGQLISNVSCFNGADGEALFTVSGFGSGSYNYSVAGAATFSGSNQTTSTIPLTGLTAGTYTITVTDTVTNCTDTAIVVIEGPAAALALGMTVTQPTCTVNGNAQLTATNGWGGYIYEIVYPDGTTTFTNTTGSFTGLSASGNYNVSVGDANGCSITDSFTINAAIAPVLEIVPNALCYTAAAGLTLTANVTAGGDGNYQYSLNGGAFTASNSFTGLAPGSHTVVVRDGNNCIDTESITIRPELTLTASASPISACATATNVTMTAAGGAGNYVYSIVADGAAPGVFTTTNPRSVTGAGNYDVYVRDNSGNAGFCETQFDLTITQAAPLALSISNTPILCSGAAQATISIVASGGIAPYSYSINNGATYQAANTFVNRPAGSYQIRVRDANNCIINQTHTITEPFTLSASAAITELVECNPVDGAEVRITNAQGGTAPYEYSFNGGSTYVPSPINFLLPGTHTVYIRDANGCTFPMTITVDPQPTPPNVTTTLDYECDGEGVVTLTADSPAFNYTYDIDGIPNTPNTSNVFNNVTPGNHTFSVNYIRNTPPVQSTLLLETFGQGPNTSITEIDPAYCYEPQNGTANSCGWTINTQIQDGEYSVTQVITSPYGSWRSPNDHSGLPNGRFLAINVGGVVGPNGIIYAKRGIEVLPNRDITISLEAFNLLRTGTGGADPDINIQLVDGGGNVIANTTTGAIPKNNNANDWQNYTVTLNPGANTNLDIVIRTNNAVTGGNDIAIDDIQAFQVPGMCPETVSVDVFVESGRAFEAGIISATNVSCNGLTDGTITFEVENFNAVAGFEYSVDGGTAWTTSLTSPVTTSAIFGAGPQTILVRKVDDTACQVTINTNINEPTPIVASASITEQFTCNNTGATITASATGGSPTYQYQLEDTVGGIISAYQNSTVFNTIPAGDYIIRARDINLCEDVIDTPITIIAPNNPTFTATPTACYSGNNDGSILVDVTSIPGNGGFLFSINGGPWLAPTPLTATSYTFGSLSAGTYNINVRDQFGCAGIAQNVTINPNLTANAVLNADLTCLADAQITINANGGSGPYTYEWSNDGGTTFFTTNFLANVFTTSTDGTYTFRVTDATTPSTCSATTNSIVVSPAVLPVISGITATNLSCNGDASGALVINIDTNFGLAPYTIDVLNNTTAVNYGAQTSGLDAGDYTVTITDSKGCFTTDTATITEPAVISYTVTDVPITCDSSSSVTNPGSITISGISGGTPEYTYYLTANNGIAPQTYITTAGNRDHTFNILSFGIYQVDIVDANGCSAFSTQIIASPPNDLDIDVTTLTADCISGGTAIVQVGAAVGSGNYEFAILENFTPPYAVSYISPDTPGGDTATFTGLTPGITYTFVVYDITTNCYYFEEADAPINTPSNMTASIDVIANVSCTGSADGNISFTFDNYDAGATSVQYEIFNSQSNISTGHVGSSVVNPPSGAISIDNFATLAPGEYYLLLSEVGGAFNGCSVYGGEFRIRESVNLLDINLAVTKNDNCNLNAGIITASGQFGTAPYQYQILPAGSPAPTVLTWTGSNVNVFNVESGDYDVYIKDAHNCIQFDTITVGLDLRPEISLTVVDECVAEGTFQVLVTLDIAGSAPYQLSVNGGPFQNITFNASNQFPVSGLSSGIAQTIAVRDLNGCADTDPFTIQAPLQFNAALTTLLDCEIAPANNAEITIDVSAGSGNYEYEISGPVNQARAALPSASYVWNLASLPGTYTITVYDTSTSVPNCLGSVIVEVPLAVAPVFAETHLDISCFGAADGSITLSQTDNGINPLTYSISPIAGSYNAATRTFENLPPDTYTITATGTNGCTTDIVGIVIDQPAAITNINATVVEFGCSAGNNSNNASITIDGAAITGGSGSYVIYEFVNNGTASIVQSGTNQTYVETNRVGGNYTVNVYDDRGCIGTTTATILPFDEILTATTAITNPLSCTPGVDGEITITTTSTNSDPTRFEYSIDNGVTYQVSNIFSGLGIGTHNFLVRHLDTGCITSTSATIVNPNTFDILVNKLSDVICFGTNSGEVTFELVDATYSGSINWIVWNTNGTASTADDTLVTNGTFATPGATAPINLFAGSYLVEIIQNDFPGCSNVEAFTIDGPSAAITGNTEVTEITCVGNDGVIEIIDVTGGWGGYTYFVGTAAPISAADFIANPRFENLGPDTYEAWVMDTNGCQELIQNTIVLVDPAPISASLQVNQENCTNLEGEIEVINTVGGQGSNYTYQLIRDGVAFGDPQTSTLFTGLGAGSYEVAIIDQWGCSFTTAAEILYEEMNVTATVVKLIDCSLTPGGAITINVAGGSANLEYTVTFPDLTTLTNATGIFTGLTQVGAYTFLVRDLDTTNPICEKTLVESLETPSTTTLILPTIVHVSCNGLSDGSVRVNLAPTAIGINEDPVYYYNLYDVTGTVLLAGPQIDPTFTGLADGNYQVEAISGRECASVRQDVTITEPNPLQVTVTATAFTCNPTNGINTATVTATVPSGAGTMPYLYSVDNINFQTGNTFEVIDTGLDQTITIYVTDGQSCTLSDSVVILALNRFTALVAQDAPISCSGPEEVTITVADNGNVANVYTFELLPVGNTNAVLTANPTYNSATFNLLAVGSYTFRITDTTTGCYFDTAVYTIAPYELVEVVATATAPVICFGDTNGALEINVSGVVNGAYDYVVYNSDGTPTTISGSGNTSTNPLSIPSLSGGNYFVRITETGYPSCSEDSNIVTIVSPSTPLTTIITPIASVTCDNNRGELLVDPTGGYAPYDIVLTNTTTGQIYTVSDVQSFVFTGLSAGSFTIAITDTNGCVLPETVSLAPAIPITASITATPLLLNCFGDTSATVSAISVSGGEGVYQYQLNHFDDSGTTILFTSGAQTSPNFNNLGAGTYSISVSDGWNCGVDTATVTINEPTEVLASLVQVTALTCTTPAQIRLTASGGTANYEFSFNGGVYTAMSGGNTHTFSVSSGIYQYRVRDANGCGEILSNQVSVDPVPPLMVTIDDSAAIINCAGETTASIRATATGGLGNYQYELYSDVALTNLVAGPQATRDFFNLGTGDYYVRVTSDDCVVVSNVIPVIEPTPLVVTDSFTNATCSGAADGTITVNLSGGSGGYLYAISPNLNQFHTQNVFTGLAGSAAGITYTVIAQDVNGCFEVLEYTIIEPDPVTVTTTVLPEICAASEDGSIALVLSGGTAPYSTSLNSNNMADFVPDQTLFTDLAAGTYVVFVRDAQGCETNVVVEIEPGVNLNATVTPMYECTGDTPISSIQVVLEDTTVAADVLYALDSTDPADMVLEPDFTNIPAGNHYLTISHANGCTNTIPFVIEGFQPLTLVLEQNNINEITAIASGGLEEYTFYFGDVNNGEDNTFLIRRTDTYTVRLVDANGCEVTAQIFMEFIDIEIPNFFTPNADGNNDLWLPRNQEAFPKILTIIFDRYGREIYRMGLNDPGWDGLYQSTELPTGDYWYVIKLNGEEDDREFVGHFTLYR